MAALCFGAAVGAGFNMTFLVGFVVGFHNAALPGARRWLAGPWAGVLSVLATDAALVGLAWARAGTLSRPPWAALGLGPVRRPGLLAGLGLLDLIAIFVLIPAVVQLLSPTLVPGVLNGARPGAGAAVQTVTILVLVVAAPVAEELFFRGWLWTALARHWPLPAVLMGTALPWLLIHATTGLWRPVLLIPAAVLFGLARHRCGGNSASILLHAANNALAVGLFHR